MAPEQDRLKRAFSEVAKSIVEKVPDGQQRAVYSATGLSTSSCEILRSHVAANERLVRELLVGAGPAELNDLLEVILPACLQLSEMQPEAEFGGSYGDLAKEWVRGLAIRGVMEEFGDDAVSPELLARFIDDLFRYKLPWGISGYLRVASDTLTLDRNELSQYCKFLPSMVKFGLPEPAACWAISVGVPSRSIAMDVAAAFREETNDETGYDAFLEWLSGVSRERLNRDFGLKSPLLEETARAIFAASLNPMLRDYQA